MEQAFEIFNVKRYRVRQGRRQETVYAFTLQEAKERATLKPIKGVGYEIWRY